MNQYIHVSFAVVLILAVGWTTLFSFSNTPGIRGYRNLGILVSYISVLAFLFVAGWRATLTTWVVFGILGGAIYVCWKILQWLRSPAGEPKPAISLSRLFHGLFVWPIMVPEAVEYSLAELGILKAPLPAPPQTDTKQDS